VAEAGDAKPPVDFLIVCDWLLLSEDQSESCACQDPGSWCESGIHDLAAAVEFTEFMVNELGAWNRLARSLQRHLRQAPSSSATLSYSETGAVRFLRLLLRHLPAHKILFCSPF